MANSLHEMTWMDAIQKVLSEADAAMHYTDIAERIKTLRLKESLGATPDMTVAATLSYDKKRDDESLFVRVAKGEYTLRNRFETSGGSVISAGQLSESEDEVSPGVIHAFGMYWKRDNVLWANSPQLLGFQGSNAESVNFNQQRGVYLLHDVRQTIYVGRSVDRPLGQRLFEHTYDRFNGRWDRFSWFGLRRVTPAGALEDVSNKGLSDGLLIATMEALLIEALEPPQNRRRGDDFRAVEYLQADDPAIKDRDLERGAERPAGQDEELERFTFRRTAGTGTRRRKPL